MPDVWLRRFVYVWPACLGIVLGVAVWRFGAPVTLALLLPLIWLSAQTRSAGAGAVAGYYLGGAYDVISATQVFFGVSAWLGILAWLGQALMLAIPWVLLWAPAGARGRAWRTLVALAATALPPFGLFNWLSPLLAAGELQRGMGLWGLAGMGLIAAAAAAWPMLTRRGRYSGIGLAIGILATPHLPGVPGHRLMPAGWVALETHLGVTRHSGSDQFKRAQAIRAATTYAAGSATQVFAAEGVAGNWRPAVQFWLADRPMVPDLWVGADVRASDGGYINALVNARTGAVAGAARIPMPFSLWRPWEREKSAKANPFGSGRTWIGGKHLALSFCYEDFLLWPHIVSLGDGTVDLMLSVANNWFVGRNSYASIIQGRSIELVTKIFAMPLLRAVNYERTGDAY